MASKLGHNMAEAVWWLVLGSILVRCQPALAWGSVCPAICSCHLSYFTDLPLNHWLEEDTINDSVPTKNQHNEVFYEDNAHKSRYGLAEEQDALLKMAMCIFQSGTTPMTLLDQLPSDVQVLSLLQSRDSGEIILEAQHMQGFHNIFYLDVQGYGHEPNKETLQNNLILSNDILRPLISLQYLNLQHIKLLSSSEQTNKINPISPSNMQVDALSNEISITLQKKNLRKAHKGQRSKGKPQNLVFLNPTEPDNEVLPYKTYLEEQQHDGLSTFAGLSNLVFLRVFSCDLHEVNWEMFEGLDKLQYLSLEQNHLLFIPEFAFYGTPNLRTLSLSHNKLLNLQSTGLAGLLELEKLDLSHNKFSHLSEFSLPPFPKLRTANFRHNPIEAVFASTFEIMNATTTLYLGGNGSILDIHPNSFLGLQSLQKLNINNVGIALLERQLLSGMPQLKELEMLGTITALSFDAFLDVPKLEKLVLRDCKIQSISMDAFYGLYGLLFLDLSNNMLQILPPGLFDQQFSLRELLLQNNLLTELPIGFFNNLPAKMVRLEGNPWHCSCSMKDWPPLVINKVKQRKKALCQMEYDKGSMCTTKPGDSYIYEKRVAPRCATPSKYKGWSIFQVLRKELRCTKKLRNKLNRKVYLRKKYEDYEKSIQTSYYGQKKRGNVEQNEDISKFNNSTVSSVQNEINISSFVNSLKESHISQNEQGNTHHLGTELPLLTEIGASTINTSTVSLNNSKNKINSNVVNGTNNDIMQMNVVGSQFAMPESYEKLNKIPGATEVHQQLNTYHEAKKLEPNSRTVKAQKPTYVRNKIDKQKVGLLTTRNEKTAMKENVKKSVQSQEDAAKEMKKEWKLEMEMKHQEKLQKYQN